MRDELKKDLSAEKKLMESEERYRTLVEASIDFIFLVDRQNKILLVNQSGARLFGKRPTDIVGKKITSLFPKHLAIQYLKSIKKMFSSGKSMQISREMIIGNKKYFVTTTLNPVKDKSGKIISVLGIVHDITSQKRTEDLVAQSEERYRTIIESANDIILFIDRKGVICNANKKLSELTGYKKSEIVGKRMVSLTKIIPRQSMLVILKNFLKRMAGTDIEPSYIIKLFDKKRKLRIFEINATALKINNKITGEIAILRDVTEREKTQTAIREKVDEITREKDKNEKIIRNIGDGVLVVDKNYKIILFNKAAADIFGYSESESIGKRYDEILKFIKEDGERQQEDPVVKKAIIKGEPQTRSNHVILVRKNGRKISVADSATPLKDNEGNVVGCVTVFQDITKEREISKLESEFISVASHQLRTPLVGIQWASERLLKKESLTDSDREYIKDIRYSAVSLSHLVDLLLNVSRIEGSKIKIRPESLSLIKFLQEEILEYKSAVKKAGLSLVFNKYPKKLTVIIDKAILSNIFRAIISNAIEYTLSGGKIEISVKKKRNTFMLIVRDTGIGIPRAEQPKIFQKFTRASNAMLLKTDGTGLGLYVAKKSTELLAGKIWFESEVNKGTTFYVELPLKISKYVIKKKSD